MGINETNGTNGATFVIGSFEHSFDIGIWSLDIFPATTMFGGAIKTDPPVMVVPAKKNLKLRVVSLPIIS
jgi:hypothetical protein